MLFFIFQLYTVVRNVKEAHECQESGETQELMLFFIFQLYTVVRNVKEAHECQESGETQEFDDDIDYLLAGIRDVEPMSTRCLR